VKSVGRQIDDKILFVQRADKSSLQTVTSAVGGLQAAKRGNQKGSTKAMQSGGWIEL
jgi:hypothetical protein